MLGQLRVLVVNVQVEEASVHDASQLQSRSLSFAGRLFGGRRKTDGPPFTSYRNCEDQFRDKTVLSLLFILCIFSSPSIPFSFLPTPLLSCRVIF
jgi:hypothetical protein